MDTSWLHTFLTVARLGSFTAAAGELHVVQSTVTARVQLLERELGARLLDRLPEGTTLTREGERAAAYAQEVLDAEERLRGLTTAGAQPCGDVVLGAPESVCAYRLPTAIATVKGAHPAVNVHLMPTGTDATFRGVLSRELDIGLVLDDRPTPPQLTAAAVGREAITLVADPEQPIARRRRVRLPDLIGYPFFLLEEGCSYSDLFVADLAKTTGQMPRVTHFGSIEAARACVQAGLGLSVLPDVAIEADVADKRLVRLPRPTRPPTPLRLIADRRRSRSPAVQVIVDAITDAAQRRLASEEEE